MMKLNNLLVILIFLIFLTPVLSISLDFNETAVGKEKSLKGNILLPPATYEKASKIKVSILSNSAESQIQDLINCTSNCNKESYSYYSYSGATAAEIPDSNFITGIRIKKGSQINIDASFKISNADSNYPDTPSIDIGNDNSIEWLFKGQAISPAAWNNNVFKGPEINSLEATELNLDSVGTCQNLYLNKSNKFQIKAQLKKKIDSPPPIGINIHGLETALNECSALTSSFSEVICTISIQDPLEDGNYKICLSTSSPNKIVLAVNDSTINSEGYRCTSSSCTKSLNTNYAVQAKSADFITALQSSQIYLESNVQSGDYLKDAIGNYLLNCNYDNDYCIIPINVSTKNNEKVKIYDLNYIETLSDGQAYNRNKFLLGVREEGLKQVYTVTQQLAVPLSSFNIKSPSEVGDHDLKVEYGSDVITSKIKVLPSPVIKANISLALAPTLELITFDASASTSNTTLAYLWNFGDNSTSISPIATHSYLLPGLYRVKLTVKDENNIEESKNFNVEIYSTTASSELISKTISSLESIKNKFLKSTEDVKSVFTGLGIESQINKQISKLSVASTLTDAEVNSILSSMPTSIKVTNKISVLSYLSTRQVNDLYGFESESYRTTLHEFNTKFTTNIDAKLVSLSYPAKQETFILVKKTVSAPQPISDISIVEIIPNSLAPAASDVSFLDSPELTRLQNYQSAKFDVPNLQDEFTFYYKVNGADLNKIKDTILIVIPSDLSPALVPFNCGDGICNPAEDSLSCPEDCHCGNNVCDSSENKTSCPEDCKSFPWLLISIIIIMGAAGFVVYKFKPYQKLSQFQSLFSSLQKSPFNSGVELQKVRAYIKTALAKGFTREKISQSLTDKGWSQRQVDYAFKKLK